MIAGGTSRAVLALCLLAGPAFAQEAVSLVPAAEQDGSAWPYRTAELRLAVGGSVASRVAAARLRWRQGGPTFVYPVTVVPNGPVAPKVSLPAIGVQQVYDIDLLTADGDVALQAEATIIWPEELTNPQAFIDPVLYALYDGPLPRWATSLKASVLLAAAALSAAAASVALIRRRGLQLVVLLGIVIVSAAVGAIWLRRQPTVSARQSPDGRLLILTTRRTVQWTGSECLAPVYVDIAEAAEDSLVVRPDGVTLTLHPQRPVLLRRLGTP